jgi:hypothetical protein
MNDIDTLHRPVSLLKGVKDPAAQAQHLAGHDGNGILSWPAAGVVFAIICTVSWWGFLLWLLFRLFL